MIARGETYAYANAPGACCSHDGRAACYAEQDVFFDGCWLKSRFYRRDGLVPGDVLSESGRMNYGVHGRHRAAVGRLRRSGRLWKSRYFHWEVG